MAGGLLILALLVMTGFLGLFSAYGLSQGFDVVSGLQHLFVDDIEPQPQSSKRVGLANVPWQRVSWQGDIENLDLAESSGLAASPSHPEVLWSINDSGNEPKIYAMNSRGEDLGSWRVDVDEATDWESMDAFVWQETAYLIIGDTGDNFRWRPYVRFLVIEEPQDLESSERSLPVAWQVKYTYPNGYHDSEALAVDAKNEQVFVLSKREHPPGLFSLPLHPARQGAPETQSSAIQEGALSIVVARFVRSLSELPRPSQVEIDQDEGHPYRHTPVGMDLAGERLLVATYKHAYLYRLDNLEAAPLRIRLPSLGQRAAVTFAAGRDNEAYISRERFEGVGIADLFKIEFQLSPREFEQMPQEGDSTVQ